MAQEANYAIASSNMQGGLFDYALQTAYGTASYEADVTSASGRKNVRGRQNAMPGLGDTWWEWLDKWVRDNSYGKTNEDGGYVFDRYDLAGAYDDFITNYWNSGMGDPPSFEDWLDWYQSAMQNEDGYYTWKNNNKYYWLPLGNTLPLLLMALIYMIILFVKRNKTAQL